MYLHLFKSILLNTVGIIQLPSFITYFVTWCCNSRCIFCDIWKKRANAGDELTVEEIASVFTQIKNPDTVRITGGEPFLRRDLGEIINRIDVLSNPNLVHITTNGILTDYIEKTMRAIKSPPKIHLKVSLDSVKEAYDVIRGVPGAYEKVMTTLRTLVELRKSLPFHLGVNQAIVNEEDMESYARLKGILKPYGIPLYVSIAFDSLNSLYSEKSVTDPKGSYTPFGRFSKENLKKLMRLIFEDGKLIGNFAEKVVNQYHVRGMYNRFVYQKSFPSPRCVALNNHLRILPNGDVPVCLYNGTIVGNLRKERLKDIWKSSAVKTQRQWIRKCPGCWQSCESAVNAIYTGDIVRGLFYRKVK